MSYQVLARKWRPRSFDELVGQPHVRKALVNALEEGRLHHAYLFTGTRGVGKTTIARIFAKCLNCEQGVTAKPCGECESCRAIDEGRFVDLIEVDAASRTRVEDTRELLDNVQYAPTRGRYKVYLIDEVHMLSGHSFNALLKTLEEPPPHVKFLLATTDPQKLPVTVLSRCLQFNLKRMAPSQIADHLAHVLREEGIACEDEALRLLARAADGSMRDALSLLDQAIAYAGGSVPAEAVREMLGTVSRDHVHRLLDALADDDASALFACVAELAEQAPDFSGVLAELIGLLHHVALLQQVPDVLTLDEDERIRARQWLERISPETVQLWYQIALQGRADLSIAPDTREAFEMTLLRMLAFRPVNRTGTQKIDPSGGEAGSRSRERKDTAASSSAEPADGQARQGMPLQVLDGGQAAAADVRSAPALQGGPEHSSLALSELDDWEGLLARLEIGGMTRALAENCFVLDYDERHVRLGIAADVSGMLTDLDRQRLERTLRDRFGLPQLALEIETVTSEAAQQAPARRRELDRLAQLEAARQAIENDPLIQALQERLGAEIIEDSIRPKKGETGDMT